VHLRTGKLVGRLEVLPYVMKEKCESIVDTHNERLFRADSAEDFTVSDEVTGA